jgi:hypothetical protein
MQSGYRQGLEAFALAPSKLLVNKRSNEVVNIASMEMLKELFAGSVCGGVRGGPLIREVKTWMQVKTWMSGTSPGKTSSV